MQIFQLLFVILCSLLNFAQVSATPLNSDNNTHFLTPRISYVPSAEQLKLDPAFALAQASNQTQLKSSTMVSYRYKLAIADLASVGLLTASLVTDGQSAPFAVLTYITASPLIHFLESNNNNGGKKALLSLLYRVGIPMVGVGIGLGSLYFIDSDAGLLTAYALGLGTIVAGIVGLLFDYNQAVKPQFSSTNTATSGLYHDATNEVLMWQSILSSSKR